MADHILFAVKDFLSRSWDGPVEIPDHLFTELKDNIEKAVRRQLTEPKRNDFRLMASNIGHPLCKLQHQQMGTPALPRPYSDKFKNIYGDVIEALAIFVLKAAGIKIDAEQTRVETDGISGKLDVEIEGGIYDIKSTSQVQWDKKFGPNGGYSAVIKDDTYGYTAQGLIYEQGSGKPFKGWIPINKNTGEWNIIEIPEHMELAKTEALGKIENTKNVIRNKEPFQKCYEPVPEKFRNKATGNMVLDTVCSMCNYRNTCWPDAILRPQVGSVAKNARLVWYTEYHENKQQESEGEAVAEPSQGQDTSPDET